MRKQEGRRKRALVSLLVWAIGEGSRFKGSLRTTGLFITSDWNGQMPSFVLMEDFFHN